MINMQSNLPKVEIKPSLLISHKSIPQQCLPEIFGDILGIMVHYLPYRPELSTPETSQDRRHM